VCRCQGCCSLSVCVCVCDLLIFLRLPFILRMHSHSNLSSTNTNHTPHSHSDNMFTPERHLPTPGQRGHSPQRHSLAIRTTVAFATASDTRLGLHKIFLYGEAFVHESTLFCANSPFGWAPHFPPVAHTIAQSGVSPDPRLLQCIPYNIGNGNIV